MADIRLPPPAAAGRLSLEECLAGQLVVREYAPEPLTVAELAQIAWAAQGMLADGRRRTAPSPADLHPFELYLVVGEVTGVTAGIYRYDPPGHHLEMMVGGDKRNDVASLALGQGWIADAPLTLILAVRTATAAARWGAWAERYTLIEAGHTAENVMLQAVGLGLGAALVGAFRNTAIRQMAGMPSGEDPVVIITVGRR